MEGLFEMFIMVLKKMFVLKYTTPVSRNLNQCGHRSAFQTRARDFLNEWLTRSP